MNPKKTHITNQGILILVLNHTDSICCSVPKLSDRVDRKSMTNTDRIVVFSQFNQCVEKIRASCSYREEAKRFTAY